MQEGKGGRSAGPLFIIIIVITTILYCYLLLLLAHLPPQHLVSRSGKGIAENNIIQKIRFLQVTTHFFPPSTSVWQSQLNNKFEWKHTHTFEIHFLLESIQPTLTELFVLNSEPG